MICPYVTKLKRRHPAILSLELPATAQVAFMDKDALIFAPAERQFMIRRLAFAAVDKDRTAAAYGSNQQNNNQGLT